MIAATSTPEWNEMQKGSHHLINAGHYALQALTLIGQSYHGGHYKSRCLEELEKAADALGFDLVKREAVKVEEAA